MKFDLAQILKALGWPLGLVAILSAVLALFGVSLDQVLAVAITLVGLWALLSVLINVLKVTGVVDDGTAGKWSAVFNLIALGVIAYILGVNPAFDFVALDARLQVIAQFGTLVLTYLINVMGTRAANQVQVKGMGIKTSTFAPVGR